MIPFIYLNWGIFVEAILNRLDELNLFINSIPGTILTIAIGVSGFILFIIGVKKG